MTLACRTQGKWSDTDPGLIFNTCPQRGPRKVYIYVMASTIIVNGRMAFSFNVQ
jgi:hypothetical protein